MTDKLRDVKTDEYTIKSGHLDVGNGHKVYFEQWGNPKAKIPVLFFHGGPGSWYKAVHKYNFDPKVHQFIGFDQRGAGNSLPYGKLEHNATQDLLDDAVKILEHLNIKQVYVYGGSWGSTLALLFSIAQPDRTKATIISGVFTGTKAEIDYLDKGYFERFYPEVWERFVASVPQARAENPAQYHYQQLASNNKEAITASAKALNDLESPLLGFDWKGYTDIKSDVDPAKPEEAYDYVPYQIYAHYLSQDCFLDKDFMVNNLSKLKTPLYIVQGRYDMCCPPITAYTVHKAVPHSKLFMTLGSHGHDPENRTALATLISTVFVY